VYAVVEPVQEQQVSVASPTRNGRVIWVVVRVVIDRNCWLHPFTQIPNVLIVKSVRVILWMAGNKNVSLVFSRCQIYARHIGCGENI
ncbi:hypothetical protein D030_4201B, partial [Vibrio parahaemolyticus AQ3810]